GSRGFRSGVRGEAGGLVRCQSGAVVLARSRHPGCPLPGGAYAGCPVLARLSLFMMQELVMQELVMQELVMQELVMQELVMQELVMQKMMTEEIRAAGDSGVLLTPHGRLRRAAPSSKT